MRKSEASGETAPQSAPDVDDPGVAAAERLARDNGAEPRHAAQVRRNSVMLFDALRGIHGLGAAERRVLEAAALMHDAGYSLRPKKTHHKGSRDLVMASALEGFSDTERRMIACVARYHRKAHPNPRHKVYNELKAPERAVVRKLAAILRIADGLDRGRCDSLHGVAIEHSQEKVRILVEQHPPSPVDIWGGMRKRVLFEEVFGVELELLQADGGDEKEVTQ